MKTIDIITKLQSLNRGFFTVADLEKITGLKRDSLKVALSRLTKQGLLTRLRRGVYQLGLASVDVRKVANQLYYPSYLSFESALSAHGIFSQIPYAQTFATTKKSKKMVLLNTEVEFTQIRKDLFFGYALENGINVAEPEKALLDQLYIVSRGKRTINIEELDLRTVDRKKLAAYASKFPAYIRGLVKRVEQYIGSTPITNEHKERIYWKNHSKPGSK